MVSIQYQTYDQLSSHGFSKTIFSDAMAIHEDIVKKTLRVQAEYTREPNEGEFYRLQMGSSLAHLLNVLQQMEHTVLYMGNFSPTQKMRDKGINRATHLLWSVENYIIRTQTIYDRSLVLVDRAFHLQSNTQQISHASVVSNIHIKRTSVPVALKAVRKSVKKYYADRHTIVHESSYMDDELRRIEALAIISADSGGKFVTEDLKYEIRRYVTKRKREYNRINEAVCESLAELFDSLQPIYASQCKRMPC